ncbi:MAG TPA: N-acetylmuramoyl-L-alanine amidase [Symbiobacteriaceae bacterium]|nr:N-acetylmuramoyl-L-alanine amidase [Symbiobacteriaceae bacterium]
MNLRSKGIRLLALGLIALLLATTAAADPAPASSLMRAPEFAQGDRLGGSLGKAFEKASKAQGVPVELLVAVAYAETRLDDHDGIPAVDNGFGLMHLVSNPERKTLEQAAALTKLSPGQLKKESAANIMGGAALLADLGRSTNGGALPVDLDGWYEAVALYSGMADRNQQVSYADQVYTFLSQGIDAQVKGEEIRVEAKAVNPKKVDQGVTIQSTDYAPAIWTPASSSNYTVANRESDYNIQYVVIHVTQGSYSGSISWFQNSSAQVSAHYVVRSSDGQVTQTVREKDIAWHAGNWTYNTQSIGIEHEGYIDNCTWFTDAMYRASAGITKSVAAKYNIPKDRSHIIGHNEVPGATHTDPGSCWNWTYYMSLVNDTATWSTIVDNSTAGRFRASANWALSTYSSQRYGADYAYATPQAVSDAAYYKVNIPSTRNYEIYMWYPANTGYNASTPVVIWKANSTDSGRVSQTVNVNQQTSGGQWVSLGTYRLLAGDAEIIAVSRWTGGTEYVIADAFKVVQR